MEKELSLHQRIAIHQRIEDVREEEFATIKVDLVEFIWRILEAAQSAIDCRS